MRSAILLAAALAAFVSPMDVRAKDSPSSLPGAGANELPSLAGAVEWLNTPPLTKAQLQGKVVLINIWTYSCINWLRTEPYVRAWSDRYQKHGLVVIGVHSPEFGFEHDVDNVRRAVKVFNIGYPVAVDSDFAIWRALDNEYWPAVYLFDAKGRGRYQHFGEGEYEKTEMAIQKLLAEAGATNVEQSLARVSAAGLEAPADFNDLQSPETYVGFERTVNFVSPGGSEPDKRKVYAAPARMRLNQWALSGDWTVAGQFALLNAPKGRIAYRFHARDLHLVMGPVKGGAPIRFRVLIDGHAPGADHGGDVDEQGNGTLTEPRLYQLIREKGPVGDRQFEIEFLDPGVQAYSFTFG